MRIFVTGAGGPSAVSFMRAVESPEVELFAGDIDPYAAGLYLVPPNRRAILRRGGDPRFIDDLLDRCTRAQIAVLVPTVDFELLAVARRRADFEARGTKVLLANARTCEICLDKWTLITECNGVCPVPRTAIVDEAFTASPWALPFLVKPRAGAGSRGVRLVDDLATLADCRHDGTLIAQEFLGGREFSVDVLSDQSARVLAVVPRSRLKIDSGIAVAGCTVIDERLVRQATGVAQRIGATFVTNIQFREDANGVAKLLDVNARFPGTMPLTVASGVNMPRLALDLIAGRPIDAAALIAREIAVVRTWQETFVPIADVARLEHDARARDAS